MKGSRKNMKNGKSRKTMKRRKNKLWNMRGCSKKNNFFPSKLRKQKGGCGCGLPLQYGGNLQTHVGSSWSSPISSWPGVSGPHDGSWLSKNNYPVDPQTQTINERTIQFDYDPKTHNYEPVKMSGGIKNKTRRRKSRRLKGGFPILTNTFRNINYGVQSAYNTLNGLNPPVNPLPYEGQLNKN